MILLSIFSSENWTQRIERIGDALRSQWSTTYEIVFVVILFSPERFFSLNFFSENETMRIEGSRIPFAFEVLPWSKLSLKVRRTFWRTAMYNIENPRDHVLKIRQINSLGRAGSLYTCRVSRATSSNLVNGPPLLLNSKI